jgi:uncharacterized Fe-S center protein
MSVVYFASTEVERLEASATLPEKFERILDKFPLKNIVEGKTVAVKMHLGWRIVHMTIHPLFVGILVAKLKEAGGKVFVTDSIEHVLDAKRRGYTEETLGAPIVSVSGFGDKYSYRKRVDFRTLKEIRVAGEIHDAEVMIDLSHVKGHGHCAYGGACKNIAMGCVTGKTRMDIHSIGWGLEWDEKACTHCELCIRACRYGANKFDDHNRYFIEYHDCVFCQHCVNACPEGAIKMDMSGYVDFQEAMALSTEVVLKSFRPGRVLYINFLTDISYLCDCWGFSFPALVPDIGIMMSDDLVAIETASLKAIKTRNFIEGTLPEGRKLFKGRHLLEKIHRKDPYIQVEALARRGLGSKKYRLVEIK